MDEGNGRPSVLISGLEYLWKGYYELAGTQQHVLLLKSILTLLKMMMTVMMTMIRIECPFPTKGSVLHACLPEPELFTTHSDEQYK